MRSLRLVFLIFIVVAVIFWSRQAFDDYSKPSIFDVPKTLSKEKISIQVRLHSRPGGAEVWSLSKSGSTDDRLYLQSASPALVIPKDYYTLKDSGYVLKLFGSFYKGKGIPMQYMNIQPKPERYPVFRYESLDLIPGED